MILVKNVIIFKTASEHSVLKRKSPSIITKSATLNKGSFTNAKVRSTKKSAGTNRKVYLNFQTELKNQVAQKTQDLHLADLKLEQQAKEDSLIGLLNRRAFDELFSSKLKKAYRTQHHLSLDRIDIDFFKTNFSRQSMINAGILEIFNVL